MFQINTASAISITALGMYQAGFAFILIFLPMNLLLIWVISKTKLFDKIALNSEIITRLLISLIFISKILEKLMK